MSFCRLCLQQNETQTQLISLLNKEDLCEKIKQCVSVEITEEDSCTNICCTCLRKVEDWYTFKTLCQESNIFLKKSRDIPEEEEKLELEERSEDIKDDVIIKKESEESQKEYKCDTCPEEFPTFSEYLNHQIVHNQESVWKCDECDQIFPSRNKLVQHGKTHRAPCPVCAKLLVKSCIQSHLKKHEKAAPPLELKCEECDERFPSHNKLLRHSRNHKGKCPVCAKIMLQSSIKSHLVKHSDKFLCPECPGRFMCRANLESHISSVHRRIKDHICETCGKAYPSKSSLTLHLKTHSEERRYDCKYCDYRGRTASAIYRHMARHTVEERICEVCSKIFQNHIYLNDHLKRVHYGTAKHQCPYCDKSYVSKYKLVLHVRMHTGVRPYLCTVCDKTFVRSDALKEHMATHGDRVWHNCETCARKFATKRGLARHPCNGTKSQ